MIEERTPLVSLTAFRDKLLTYREPVLVSRRDAEGNLQILGFWTPYMQYPPDSAPIPGDSSGRVTPLDLPVDEPVTPRVIGSPGDVATLVRPDPVRSVPKPSQQKRSKR